MFSVWEKAAPASKEASSRARMIGLGLLSIWLANGSTAFARCLDWTRCNKKLALG